MRSIIMASLMAATLASLVAPHEAGAQHGGHGAPAASDSTRRVERDAWHVMIQAIPVVTRAVHTVEGSDLTEGYLSQAAAMGRADLWSGHLRLEATLNAEGLTMERGELSTGAFGEGYVDRRHPHTYLHELIVSGIGSLGPVAYSASAGRGFATFGTDDPMMRPFEKYPINHHLAQILERAMVGGAVRWGPAMFEASIFSGEEPTSPGSMPRLGHIGDSWAVRGTVLPLRGLEVQASYANVESPELAGGFGLDQLKRSVSGRFVSAAGRRYVLAEWARTVERDAGRAEDIFAFESAVVEGALSLGRIGLGVRLEQTERPEEERLGNPFRVARPAADIAISGITRWRSATLALTLPSAVRGPVRGYPFLEIARLSPASRDARSVFESEAYYGNRAPLMVTAGVRLRFGPLHARMGRYGVAVPHDPPIRMLGTDEDFAAQHEH